ncbi:hypothetical protein HP567_000880 [Brevibacillus sp. M2.1A]|uniref:hypothetical protein n=1 Tax=Brevibacillus TaxID=55080 RepID=UPI00156B3ED8|nr:MULTISPECIES: hypothetical protein [Brevibacillus]MBY0084913.1 hypothetical protein [Brevibacillus brevis]MCC8433175.1 hypothetical protein [Brevibacillus sp. M2.1A]UKL00903.1 hypothetical protein FO446_27330 [Brevibacillus brevis]
MKKIVIAIFIISIAGGVILKTLYSPENTVRTVIDNIANGTQSHVQMKQDQIELIRSYFEFAAKNNLKSPEVSVRQVEGTGDHIKLIAEFLIIDYDENNRIRKVYAGNLLFTLQRSSFYKWDVINIEEKMKLSL